MTTMHDNEFNFVGENGVSKINFKYNQGHVVSEGQPWGGVTATGGSIDIQAGRHGTTECAKWFTNFVANDYDHMIHTCDGDNLPQKLNFAITGTLTVDGKSYDICLGQGHRDSTGENNWHLASQSIIADEDAKNGTMDGMKLRQSGTHEFIISRP